MAVVEASGNAAAADRVPHVTLTQLKQRGWSDGLIRTLLDEPDRLAKNPHYRSGVPMKLYVLSRVEVAEQHEAFQQHQARREKLVKAGLDTAAKRRAALLEVIEAMTVSVTAIALPELLKRGVSSWEKWQGDYGRNADDATKQRWAVNFARHHLTEYDTNLEAVARQIGASLAKQRIREKIYAAIGARWPELTQECDRQLERRTNDE